MNNDIIDDVVDVVTDLLGGLSPNIKIALIAIGIVVTIILTCI